MSRLTEVLEKIYKWMIKESSMDFETREKAAEEYLKRLKKQEERDWLKKIHDDGVNKRIEELNKKIREFHAQKEQQNMYVVDFTQGKLLTKKTLTSGELTKTEHCDKDFGKRRHEAVDEDARQGKVLSLRQGIIKKLKDDFDKIR